MKSPIEELRESRDHLFESFSAGEVTEDFPQEYTEIVDQYFRRSLQESATGRDFFRRKIPFALAAVGGYGRGELCVQSDIDILILFGSRIPAEARVLGEEIFYPLWDLGFDLGYGTRTLKDCLGLCSREFKVLTSMMDTRFICGDSPLYLGLMQALEKNVITKKAGAFAGWLEAHDKIRLERYGDASHLLEPNLKEGVGGLRDYHHMVWLARAFFHLKIPRDLEYTGKLSHNEFEDLRKNLHFIWLVRNHLHQLTGRKNDRLDFEYQEQISHKLGFRDGNGILGVEQFLGKLHAAMASIKNLRKSFARTHLPQKQRLRKRPPPEEILGEFRVFNDEIHFPSATAILAKPFLLMEAFEKSSATGYPLSTEATRLVREFRYLVDDPFRRQDHVVRNFLNTIGPKAYFPALDQMFETGFLDVLIPEFGEIRDLVQFDAYHTFPVGRHCVETLRHLKCLGDQRDFLLPTILSELSNPEPLFLSALFHDIGKGEKDHLRGGVEVTRNILKRFQYDHTGSEEVFFLVGHHLLLAETATRRDLNDEKVVVQCARTIGDVERLKMLYLLTWADSKATGPRAWNEWIANLVEELFFKVLHILERKELATVHAAEKVDQTLEEVRRLVKNQMPPPDLENAFEAMSPRYLLNTPAREITEHLRLAQGFRKQLSNADPCAFVLETAKNDTQSCWDLTFVAQDRPGLFSEVAGVLALQNINILSARIYTWRDGTAVDVFKVTEPLDPTNPGLVWERVKRDLEQTFRGKLSLPYRLGKKAAPSILSRGKRPSRPPQVLMDNESSDFFTLIEVFADDRVGLLYLITKTLFDLRLDIGVAKIATRGDQIADIFYVRDLEGEKVEDNARLEEIRCALLYELENA